MFTTLIETIEDSLELLGGKGRSLAKMKMAGFNVPGGFVVTADAYRTFIEENGLQLDILSEAKPELRAGYPVFDKCAERIHGLVMRKAINGAMLEEIRSAYSSIGIDVPVAVRSSANAEDLPDFSFAGQQETYLNVRGETAVAEAVQKCWASLWTAQAISYRHQNGIDQGSVAMAVVVQVMVPSEVSGILFTANPATGERSEIILNASFGLGEAVVGGEVTPDTFVVDRDDLSVKESILGPKEHQVVYDGDQGVRMEAISDADREQSCMSPGMIKELCAGALEIEALNDGQPQDIEWAFCDGVLHLLQSRPITNLPVQPIELDWIPTPPAKYVSRRQIVENMPAPICPLFEELYLTEGLEFTRKKTGSTMMVGGGPMFVTVNGWAYQRFDWPLIHEQVKELEDVGNVSEEDIEAAEWGAAQEAQFKHLYQRAAEAAPNDVSLFRSELNEKDRRCFDQWYSDQSENGLDRKITIPESENTTYVAFNHVAQNDAQLKKWYEGAKPRIEATAERWRELDIHSASDDKLLEAIVDMGIAEGDYWSNDSSHTFGCAKSTDDQLQCFLRETLPEHNFISGQFLSGIESKTMQSNADLYEIAEKVRLDKDLTYTVLVVPSPFLMQALRDHDKGGPVVAAINRYLQTYGHQGYSMDFIEPTQVEDPSALFASLKSMVRDPDYHPSKQSIKATAIREQKLTEITELLSGLEYWQFRFRLWFALKYNYIREEVAFRFGYTWSIFRPVAFELGRRLKESGSFKEIDDIFFLTTDDIKRAIDARRVGSAMPELGVIAAERREFREAAKLHHPPGTLPAVASAVKGISFKETQIKNDESSNIMRGFPVSSGKITGKASVVIGPGEFDKMVPGTILVSPLTTPAWTQLFAHAEGLVTDVGSILAHGSIVAREYGIPAVLGVGNGTKRIRHGQMITIDGDAGTVEIHQD